MTNDKQRERLVELLIDSEKAYAQYLSEACDKAIKGDVAVQLMKRLEFYADRLLADGVIVPPCKVGDVVYFVPRNSGKPIGTVEEHKIVMIGKTASGFCAKSKLAVTTSVDIPHFKIDNYSFFATREEAEKALGGVQG